MEIWKQSIVDMYEVSNIGRVRNKKTHKVISQHKTGNTIYRAVFIYESGRQRAKSVHRLVAIAFVPNPENKKEVNHFDGNKLNNAASNLKWSTRSENIQHMYDTGLKTYMPLHYKGKFGKEHNRSKSVRCVETGIVYGSQSEAGRLLNIDHTSISWSIKHKKPIYGMHFEIGS